MQCPPLCSPNLDSQGPWGKRLSGLVPATKRSYTGQSLDDSGLLFYNARSYDPQIGRFISADSIVPGNAAGGMDGVAYKPLTVDFHEPGFAMRVAQENQFGPWYTLSDNERQELGSPFGPATPQALNRYAYVLNNPMKWTDPGGHSVYLSHDDAKRFVQYLRDFARELYLQKQGKPNGIPGILSLVKSEFGKKLGPILYTLLVRLQSLEWEKIASIYALAQAIETVNNESPDGVAIATMLNSGDPFPDTIYILNRTTGEVTGLPMSYIMQLAIFGGGTVWDIGMAFGDDPEYGHFVFTVDQDGKGIGPENVCPSEAQSC